MFKRSDSSFTYTNMCPPTFSSLLVEIKKIDAGFIEILGLIILRRNIGNSLFIIQEFCVDLGFIFRVPFVFLI